MNDRSQNRIRRSAAFVVVGVLSLPVVTPALAQQPGPAGTAPPQALTLESAIGIAEERSEQIAIAQFGVAQALAGQKRARAEKLPQVSGSASYDRTLKSEFSGLFDTDSPQPACDPFVLDPSETLDERVAEIERALDCGAVGNPFAGGGFSDLPFGRANTWRVNLSIAQALYAGGRIAAQEQVANVGRSIAEDSVRSARAQLVIDVTQAFYDAALADRLVTIAEATLAQAEATLAQVELSHRAGRIPEFELLRARVARDNQRPALIRARAQRTVAYLRFRQLLEIPVGEPVTLIVDLDDPRLPPEPRFVGPLAEILARERASMTDDRLVVRQVAGSVRISEEAVTIARSQRLPYVSVNSALGGVNYEGAPGFDAWRANWTLGAYVSVPLFTGGRLKADEMAAQAGLGESQARLKLTRELSLADAEAAFAAFDAAQATWEASAGTVEQSGRAYEIADLRYREGLSTQLELLDARLVLQQAQVTRAQAARDLQIARARLALLPDLPLGSAATAAVVETTRGAAGALASSR